MTQGHPTILGEGAAIRTGLKGAPGTRPVVKDASLKYLLADYGQGSLRPERDEPPSSMEAGDSAGTPGSSGVRNGQEGGALDRLRGPNLQQNRFGAEREVTGKMSGRSLSSIDVPMICTARTRAEVKRLHAKHGLRRRLGCPRPFASAFATGIGTSMRITPSAQQQRMLRRIA